VYCVLVIVIGPRHVRNLCVADSSSSRAFHTQNHYKSSSKSSSSSLKDESSSRHSSMLKDSLSAKDADDTDPSRVKTLCDSPDHISAKLNQRILSADHDTRNNNVASNVADDDDTSSINTESTSLRTASHRPKTVKTLGSKMRSTGKCRTSCKAFVHEVTFYCDSLLTFFFGLWNICRLSDEKNNCCILSLNSFVCSSQFV